MIFTALGLGLFNITFVLGFLIAGIAILFSLLTVSGAICFMGITLIFSPILDLLHINHLAYITNSVPYYEIFLAGTILSSFGFLSTHGMLYLNKNFYKSILRYIEKNINIVKNS